MKGGSLVDGWYMVLWVYFYPHAGHCTAPAQQHARCCTAHDHCTSHAQQHAHAACIVPHTLTDWGGSLSAKLDAHHIPRITLIQVADSSCAQQSEHQRTSGHEARAENQMPSNSVLSFYATRRSPTICSLPNHGQKRLQRKEPCGLASP